MRIGILGDIHANVEALSAVVDALRRERVDTWVQVGDIVGYGPEPSACIDIVRELGCITCLGNHDAAVLGHAFVDQQELDGLDLRPPIHDYLRGYRPGDAFVSLGRMWVP